MYQHGTVTAVRQAPRRPTIRPAMIHAQIVLLDRFDPLEALALHEVLCAGGTASGGALTAQLVSPDGPGPVADLVLG